MGFGTLFFGYFLLLNITNYTITDLIASLIMAMGLYKLSTVNTPFKNGFYTCLGFSLIGASELVLQIIAIFDPLFDVARVISYVAIPRYFIISIITAFILSGIDEVADGVGLKDLASRARRSIPFALIVYALSAILEVPELDTIKFMTMKVIAVISVIVLFATLITVSLNLITIYKAYAKICMPEDVDNSVPNKPSKFGFVNKFREHRAQKQMEYAEYKLEKFKKKISKKKKK